TDEIAHRFYGCEPPRYLILSATLLLPLRAAPVDPADRHRLARQLRDLYYNPQRHLENGEPETRAAAGVALRAPRSALNALAAEKQAWIDRQPTEKNARRERFHALRTVTEQLRSHVTGRLSALEQELLRCHEQLQANAVLLRRDYAFCLYPEAMLRSF